MVCVAKESVPPVSVMPTVSAVPDDRESTATTFISLETCGTCTNTPSRVNGVVPLEEQPPTAPFPAGTVVIVSIPFAIFMVTPELTELLPQVPHGGVLVNGSTGVEP